MDSFEECDIRYLTASSIMAYRDNPAQWVTRYLFGHKQSGAPKIARTIAIKGGLKHWLYGAELGKAEDLLDDLFRLACEDQKVYVLDPAARAEHSIVLPLFLSAVNGFNDLGEGSANGSVPLAVDLASSVWADGVGAPFISSPFAVFQGHLVDVKPGSRCPSTLQKQDLLNCAVHARHHPDVPVSVIYATHKKHKVFTATRQELEEGWEELVYEARALQSFLKAADSREHALSMVPLNGDNFRWDSNNLAIAKSIKASYEEKQNGLQIAPGSERLQERVSRSISGDMLSNIGSGDTPDGLEGAD